MKAGTTSLYYYLKEVPGIYMSPNKEPNYFAAEDIASSSKIVIRDKGKYLSLFANADDQVVIGEASTTYLYSGQAPNRIHEVVPEAKIVIILRDPVERAFSQYLSNVRNKNLGVHKMSFLEAVKKDYNSKYKGIGTSILYIERGLYFEQVKRYFDLFGRSQVKVLIFEDYIKNAEERLKEVLEFLNVKADIPTNTNQTYNKFFMPSNPVSHSIIASKKLAKAARLLPESGLKTYLRKLLLHSSRSKPKVPDDARTFLGSIFADDVNKLEGLLGQILPWKV